MTFVDDRLYRVWKDSLERVESIWSKRIPQAIRALDPQLTDLVLAEVDLAVHQEIEK